MDRYLDCHNSRCAEFSFEFNKSGPADLAIVLNFPKKPHWLRIPQGRTVKVLQEPVIRNFWTHRFTYAHSAIYDLVLAHSGGLGERVLKSHGHYPMHVKSTQVFPEKTLAVSIVASTLRILPGHKSRADAVDRLLLEHPELVEHTFGKGRRFVESKEDALLSYRYSLAIENDSSPSYFTEKILDCYATGVVPIYFGAPDIEEFFPSGSLIRLADLSADSLKLALDKTSDLDYENRLPALREAAILALKYSRLCCLAAELLDQRLTSTEAPRKLKLLAPSDTFITAGWRFFARVALSTGLVKFIQTLRTRFSK